MNGFFDKIGIDLGILVVMLMILVLILIVIILNMSLGLHRMNRRYAMFMKGADGQSLERQFAQKLKFKMWNGCDRGLCCKAVGRQDRQLNTF